jgi:FixJ family two-component response regulator
MSRARQTVTIIDDDASVRRALARLLRSVGLSAATFASAEEYLQTLPEPAPGCLILDVHLPGLSGLELYERLKVEGRCLPVVFITAYETDRLRQLALAAGAVAFLPKPFEEQALLDAVARALCP